MQLTFSDSMVVLPSQACILIERQLPGCNFQSINGDDSKKFFICKRADFENVSNLRLSWSIIKSK